MAAERRWLRLRSVRVRTTAAAVLVVGVAIAIGAGVLVWYFRDFLLGEPRPARTQRLHHE